ncbi:MAG: sugar phosphate isomerase/epimerase family protein [Beutenbergiaceae bacterium]
MNPVGCHGLTFTDAFTTDDFDATARRIAAAGFDLYEVPLMDAWGFDAARGKHILDDLGLASVVSVGHDGPTDISQEDPAQAKAGEELLNQGLQQAHTLGASMMTGVLYSSLKRYGRAITPAGRAQSQQILGRVADRAADLGMSIGLEIVNRYETNVINSLKSAAAFTDEIGRPNVKLHIDTFHMNIEEDDLYHPVLEVADRIGYVHVSENTRGYLGSGRIDFEQFFQALATIGYTGPLTFETFSASQLSADFAGLLAVWRDFYSDPDDLAAHAAAYVRRGLAAAQSAVS